MTDKKDAGHIYILQNEAMFGIYKIGATPRDDLSKCNLVKMVESWNGTREDTRVTGVA